MGSTVCSALYYRARCTIAHVGRRVARRAFSVVGRMPACTCVACCMLHGACYSCMLHDVCVLLYAACCRSHAERLARVLPVACCVTVVCCNVVHTYKPYIQAGMQPTIGSAHHATYNMYVRCMLHVAPAAGFALRRKAHRPVTHRLKDRCPARVRVCECVRVCVCVCLCVCTCVRVIVGAHMCVRASRSSCFY